MNYVFWNMRCSYCTCATYICDCTTGKVISLRKHQAKICMAVEVKLYIFWTSALGGDEWLASGFSPRAGLDMTANRNFLPQMNMKPQVSSPHLVSLLTAIAIQLTPMNSEFFQLTEGIVKEICKWSVPVALEKCKPSRCNVILSLSVELQCLEGSLL